MRLKSFFVIIFVLFIAAAISAKPALVFVAKKQIKDSLGAALSVQNCELSPLSEVSLGNVEIDKPGVYHLKAGKITVYYSPLSLCRRDIAKLVLRDLSVSVDLPHKSFAELSAAMALPSRQRTASAPAIQLEQVELTNFNVDLKFNDLDLTAAGSAVLDPANQSFDSLNLKISSLNGLGIALDNGSISAAQGRAGELSIQKLQYNKFKAGEIGAQAVLSGKNLQLTSFSGETFNGRWTGNANVTLVSPPEYLANLSFSELDLDRLGTDLELKEKFEMSGRMSGRMTVTGRGAELKILDGTFSSTGSGGTLVVKNNEFLENMARNSQQPLDIVVASFKNYHYNVGKMKLSLEKNSLVFDMALDGETGKRNINITLHDFNLTKEKP